MCWRTVWTSHSQKSASPEADIWRSWLPTGQRNNCQFRHQGYVSSMPFQSDNRCCLSLRIETSQVRSRKNTSLSGHSKIQHGEHHCHLFRQILWIWRADPDPDRRGLTIGGFKSAFLANLEASYLFNKLHHIMEHHVRVIGTYCDDEIIVFRGQHSNEWLCDWLRIFPREVDQLLYTQFTMEIWRLGQQSTSILDSEVSIYGIRTFQRISINGNMAFPYLDIQLLWNKMGCSNFNVYH